MKKTLLTILLGILPVLLYAEIEVNGIKYRILSSEEKTLEVSNSKYSGDIIIPEDVEYEGEIFTVTSIGFCAFYECKNITSISIPNSIKTIKSFAFGSCEQLSSIKIPASVDYIEDRAFYNCLALSTVYIYDIEKWCKFDFKFANSSPCCKADRIYLNDEEVTSLEIPESISKIGDFAFYNWKNLKSVTIPQSVKSIGSYSFKNCTNLKSISFLGDMQSIGRECFSDCTSLSFFKTPESLTELDEGLFSGCSSLETVILTTNINKIRTTVFSSCTSLHDIFCFTINVPSTDSSVFYNTDISNITLHVLENSISGFKSVSPWKDFKDIIALTSDDFKLTNIESIYKKENSQEKVFYYDLNGKYLKKPKHGINIMRTICGKTKKIVIK